MSDDQKSDKVGIAKPTPEQVRERQAPKLAAMMRSRAKATAQAPAAPASVPPPQPAQSLPVLPCPHGTDLTGAEREAAGLSHAKQWKRCDHPERPKGEFVCPCQGCGPKCSGYPQEPDAG